MGERKKVTMDRGSESRTISWGENEDGTVYVRETSMSDLAEFAFGALERQFTLALEPSDKYGLTDVEDRVDKYPGNCFICDFEDFLLLWEAPYTR